MTVGQTRILARKWYDTTQKLPQHKLMILKLPSDAVIVRRIFFSFLEDFLSLFVQKFGIDMNYDLAANTFTPNYPKWI